MTGFRKHVEGRPRRKMFHAEEMACEKFSKGEKTLEILLLYYNQFACFFSLVWYACHI